ncbi:MAG: adenosylmethionine--8-amino-7-oxononanoate transaminase [Rhodospirillales bacterium]|nr:adenosylmethionine--8-amino-7-oxononanoate transaminase [Rhodospirillales bacterium]
MSKKSKETLPMWYEQGREHVWLPYTQMKRAPLALPAVATNGTRITLSDGRELVDGIASWWTACHGYNHPHITKALETQLHTMPHVMLGGFNHEPAMTLAQRLSKLLPGDLNHVFFADSGSVAVEVALKMALQYWINTGENGRDRFVSFNFGYHGDTIGAMSVCDPDEGMHSLFKGILPQQFIVDLPRTKEEFIEFESFLKSKKNEIAGVIIEPLVQGAGGMKFHDSETLAAIYNIAKKHNVLFIADEIMTGFGRTGTMFACNQAEITPDIMCIGKALTGGAMTLAATVASEEVYQAFYADTYKAALMHGPTYMANPLACAAANASLDLFEQEPRLAQGAALQSLLADALEPCRALPGVVDVRAKGAIGVVQVERLRKVSWLAERFLEQGVWIQPYGDIFYLTPAFTIDDADFSTLTDSLCRTMADWSRL